uniref:Tc1-like transposase DDE domain-containing protein n=1 Tax=Globisporangium ultimum (strain ATCC 200006 / CBS 805.95 / DAOM BR144) TaxID=431595 RepID=K3WAQ6_GLOUD
NKPKPVFVAQVLAKRFDCNILLLPVSHPELNPIEMVWSNMKGYMAKNNVNFLLTEVEQLTAARFEQIGAEEWTKYVKHCIKVEDDYYNSADCVPYETEDND